MFLLSLFGPPPFSFNFSSLCLSLSLSLYIVLFFLSSFLSFFFLLSFGSLFLSLSLFFCLLCFCFMKGTTSKYSITKFFHQSFLFFWVSCLVFSLNPFFLSLFFFLILSCVFVQHQCFWFQKTQVEKHQFLVKRGVATKRFLFYEPVFCKM